MIGENTAGMQTCHKCGMPIYNSNLPHNCPVATNPIIYPATDMEKIVVILERIADALEGISHVNNR